MNFKLKLPAATYCVAGSLVIMLSSFSYFLRSGAAPTGYTGADGVYCTSCHNSFGLNTGAGSVTVSGLPASGYTPGTTYSFSLKITHTAANRKRWGFSMIAVNSSGQPVGSFSGSNPNATDLGGGEYGHAPAVTTSNSASYTFANLSWTSPANPTQADQQITFYYTGNAADGTGGSNSDYIYAGTLTVPVLATTTTYRFTGNGLWSDPANWQNGQIPPVIISGNAEIIIDPDLNGECVLDGSQTVSTGASFKVMDGKRFRISGNLQLNQ